MVWVPRNEMIPIPEKKDINMIECQGCKMKYRLRVSLMVDGIHFGLECPNCKYFTRVQIGPNGILSVLYDPKEAPNATGNVPVDRDETNLGKELEITTQEIIEEANAPEDKDRSATPGIVQDESSSS